jgi:hypothetical protein
MIKIAPTVVVSFGAIFKDFFFCHTARGVLTKMLE